MVVATGNDDGLILWCATHELLTTAFSEAFDKNLKYFSFVLFVLIGTDGCLQVDEFIESANLLLFRNVIR